MIAISEDGLSDREQLAKIKRDLRKKLAEEHDGGHNEELGDIDQALCPLCDNDQKGENQ